jgi:membrane-bound lytic murein transglycosylase MltF
MYCAKEDIDMRTPITGLLLLSILSAAACNQQADNALPPPTETAATEPPAVSEPLDGVPGAEASEPDEPAEEVLPSLDDLLPEQFEVLTAGWTGDLDGMVDRRVIRTLVVGGGPQFFYYRGKPRGMIVELLQLLQADVNTVLDRRLQQVEIVPMPVSRDRLIPALLSGQADLVAADLTITENRSALVDFSVPVVRNVDEIVVFGPGMGEGVASIDDLAGHNLYVRRSSSYHEHLVALNQEFAARGLAAVTITEANESLRVEDILEMVNAGLVRGTVIDNYKAKYWSALLTDMEIREDLVIHGGGEIAWAFRKGSPQLASVVNDFVKGHRQGTLIGNVLINRYMENLQWVRQSTSDDDFEKLRSVLELFRSSGQETGLDPLMLAAQAYQESELDHSKVSPAGAIGMMQIKPSTAADRNVGVDDISTPAENIRAGAIYMRFLMDRYFSDAGITPMQRWFFGLAAYNAGPARIQRLRNQAASEGLNPDVWQDNVEYVVARKIGRETVRYVGNIFKYYVAYRLAFEQRAERQSLSIQERQ